MSYYKIIDGQRYDRKLLELAEELIQGRGDGRISKGDAEQLLESVQDGRGITDIEKESLAYVLTNFKFTESAEIWLKTQIDLGESVDLANQIKKIVEEEFDIQGLSFKYEEAEAQAQENLPSNKISFPEATRQALHTVLNGDEEEESPRKIIINVYGLFPGEVEHAEEKIQAKLREHLSHGTLELLPNVDWSDLDMDFDFSPPEHGETAAKNWVFSLYLAELSDHLYWIIIDRLTEKEPYVYGFN